MMIESRMRGSTKHSSCWGLRNLFYTNWLRIGCRWEAAGAGGEDEVAEVLFTIDGDCGARVIAVGAKGVARVAILGGNEAEGRN